jgi:hypothetical protein
MFQHTVTAYKLFRTLKTREGLYPLFIGKTVPTPENEWIEAQFLPTKGFAPRPGWHAGVLPIAPHLRTRENRIHPDRVWAEVSLPADYDWQRVADQSSTRDIRDRVPTAGHYCFKTNKMQGGAWLIGGAIRIEKVLNDDAVYDILSTAGFDPRPELKGV